MYGGMLSGKKCIAVFEMMVEILIMVNKFFSSLRSSTYEGIRGTSSPSNCQTINIQNVIFWHNKYNIFFTILQSFGISYCIEIYNYLIKIYKICSLDIVFGRFFNILFANPNTISPQSDCNTCLSALHLCSM